MSFGYRISPNIRSYMVHTELIILGSETNKLRRSWIFHGKKSRQIVLRDVNYTAKNVWKLFLANKCILRFYSNSFGGKVTSTLIPIIKFLGGISLTLDVKGSKTTPWTVHKNMSARRDKKVSASEIRMILKKVLR